MSNLRARSAGVGLVLCLALGILTAGTSEVFGADTSASTSMWLQSWPMPNHDPQRTNRSPATGPLHPVLLFTHPGFYISLVGPDDTMYGREEDTISVAALDRSGREQWVVPGCCDGSPVLAPDGTVFDWGSATTGEANNTNGTEAVAIGADGSMAWRIVPFGLPKGAVPLVTAGNLLYASVIGPHNGTGSEPYIGLNVVSTHGQVLHHLPTVYDPALSSDGTIYDASKGYIEALNPRGKELWRHPLPGNYTTSPLVGRKSAVYVGYTESLASYRPSGRLLWRIRVPDHPLALAERADGTLLVAGRAWLQSINPSGKGLWRVAIGRTPGQYERPTLIVDAAGTAYVGSGDGIVRVIAASGRVLAQLSTGGPQLLSVPSALLSPNGRLIVNGSDGILRVYGSNASNGHE